MCEFEDIDLYQVRAKRDVGIEPRVYTRKSMEELGEDEATAEDQENYKDEGGENV